jgi:hypothetical protein
VTCLAGHGRRAGRSKPEIADVFRQYAHRLPALSGHLARTVRAIINCRTAALGGHVQKCDSCGHRVVTCNSCRNRNCPKCQGIDELRWVERQQRWLLPIDYHHVVFTVPDALHPLLLRSPRLGYGLLFAAVAETLREVALRPKNLGARIGFTAVLHTWSQLLAYHPHIHCIVTGGGLGPDGSRWIPAKRRFLFFVGVLGQVFRGKLLHKLEQALDSSELVDPDQDGHALLRRAARKDWNVYSKPPFAGPEQVLRYLGRYTHRIAISNQRLVSVEDGNVTFRWRDRADGNAVRFQTLDAAEFLRRFLLHVLPPGFQRIRHYGLLANGCRHRDLETCRRLLRVEANSHHNETPSTESWQELLLRVTGTDVTRCPECKTGRLHTIGRLEPVPSSARPPPSGAAT